MSPQALLTALCIAFCGGLLLGASLHALYQRHKGQQDEREARQIRASIHHIEAGRKGGIA
jgi:hypothetical protein